MGAHLRVQVTLRAGHSEQSEAQLHKGRVKGDVTLIHKPTHQARALEKGVPYQTFVVGLLHRFVGGHLVE